MVGEQLKMLSHGDYVLAIGLHSTDATGMEAMDTADCACKAIQVGLHAIKHVAGIAFKVCVNLELVRWDEALSSLTFDADTKAQLWTLLLGYEELFGGKLDEASDQAGERGHHQCELKVAFRRLLLLPLHIHSRLPASVHLSWATPRAKKRAKKARGVVVGRLCLVSQ